jgi:CheY-like chemotaxis protein
MTAKNRAQFSTPISVPFQNQTNLFHSVLIVEDNELIRRVNADVLIRSGYEVNVADDGAVAWDALQSNHYDLLVTDNDMPELSGVDLLYKLQAARKALPVVLASGTMPEEKLKLHPGLHIDATLLKPYTSDEFLATVRKVIRATDGVTGPSASLPDWQDQPLAAGMKISLQNSKTGKFMRCDSTWTADINEALNFHSFQRAVSFGMNVLKDPFQVLQIEESHLLGAVIIAISNLLRSPQTSCESPYAAPGISFDRISGVSERPNSLQACMGRTPHSNRNAF